VPTFVNTDVHRRTWLNVQGPGGSTLELGPGETVELDIADDHPLFGDPHLKAVLQRRHVVRDPHPAPEAPEPAKE
jgi:hypothetical protein